MIFSLKSDFQEMEPVTIWLHKLEIYDVSQYSFLYLIFLPLILTSFLKDPLLRKICCLTCQRKSGFPLQVLKVLNSFDFIILHLLV